MKTSQSQRPPPATPFSATPEKKALFDELVEKCRAAGRNTPTVRQVENVPHFAPLFIGRTVTGVAAAVGYYLQRDKKDARTALSRARRKAIEANGTNGSAPHRKAPANEERLPIHNCPFCGHDLKAILVAATLLR